MLTDIIDSSTFVLVRDLGVIMVGSSFFLFGLVQTYKFFWPYIRPAWTLILNTILEEHIKKEQEEHKRIVDLIERSQSID